MSLDEDLLEILICPQCRGELTSTPQEKGLACPACKLIYPVHEGIPVMMVAEAEPLEESYNVD